VWFGGEVLTVVLDITFRPGNLESMFAKLEETLRVTRGFDGCEGVEVLFDASEPAHVLVIERWASDEADAAYRDWRAGPGRSRLAELLASAPVLTRYGSSRVL
jgi:quinol monooxygenase YgiN